ncbi:MAG: hypothetical protein ACREJD_07230 [Phycisphaerales bacterium]
MSLRVRCISLLAALLHLVMALASPGQTITWTGAGDGASFELASNWSPAIKPGATTDCIIAAGPGQIVIGNSPVVRSLTLGRNITLDSCAWTTLTNGLTLQNGAVVTLSSSSSCIGLAFSTNAQSIAGNGTIFLKSYSTTSIVGPSLHFYNGADVTIEPGITIRVGPDSTSANFNMNINAGCRVRNQGSILVQPATGKLLRISGDGKFDNEGVVEATNAALDIRTGHWSNTGTFRVTNTAFSLAGEYTALGNIVRAGGTFTLGGKFITPTLTASQATGDLILSGIDVVGATIGVADGAKLTFAGTSTLRACTITSDLEVGCATLAIREGLTLGAKLTVKTPTTGCFTDSIQFQGATAQTISGPGSIEILSSAILRLSADTGADVTLDPSLPITFLSDSISGANFAASLAAGSTLRLRTPLLPSGPAPSVAFSGSGTLINESQIVAASGSTLTVAPGTWTNPGTISASGAKVTLGGTYATFEHFTRTGGTLALSGTFTGPLLETIPALGSFSFLNFSASSAIIRTTGSNTITFNGNNNLTACVLDGQFVTIPCGAVTVRSGLTFVPGTVWNINLGEGSCSDLLIFDSGVQSVSGSALISIKTTRDMGIRVTNNAAVTWEPGITFSFDSVKGVARLLIDSGSKLTNKALLRLNYVESELSIFGAGTFENKGQIDIGGGNLILGASTWSSTGTVNLGPAGTLTLYGPLSNLASLNRDGGTIIYSDTLTGGVFETGPFGDIFLNGSSYTNITFRTAPGARFFVAGHVTFDGCRVDGELALQGFANLTVRNSLEIMAGAHVSMFPNGGSDYVELHFRGGTQSLKGAGTFTIGGGVLRVSESGTLTLESGLTFRTALIGVGNIAINVEFGSKLINAGTLVHNATGRGLEISGAFENSGLIDLVAGETTINSSAWSNTGLLRMSSTGTLRFVGTFSTFGPIERTAGTLRFQGSYTGSALDVTALGGNLLCEVATFTGTTITGNASARPIFGDETALNACAIAGEAKIDVCRVIRVSNGLTLNVGATLGFNVNGACSPRANIRFSGADQTLTGSGTLALDDCDTYIDGNVAIAPGVTVRSGSQTYPNSTLAVTVATGKKLTNFGTLTMDRVGKTLAIGGAGAFLNFGHVGALAGATQLQGLSGDAGDLLVGSGASLALAGNFKITSPIAVTSGASLSLSGTWTTDADITATSAAVSLSGTWTNNAHISVDGGTVTLAGTWINAGIIDIANASANINGSTALGNFNLTNTRQTYTGYPAGGTLLADASTGDISLGSSANFKNVTLRARDDARFILPVSTVTLDGCTLDAGLTITSCATLQLVNGLTFVSGASIVIDGACPNILALAFSGTAPQTISGPGQIVFRNRGGGDFIQVIGTATIGEEVSLIVPSDATQASQRIILLTGAKLINRGLISLQKPDGAFTIQGAFQNLGTIDVQGGSLALTALSGPLGDLSLAPGCSLILDGTYTIDHDLAVSNALLSLAGTWSSTAALSVTSGQFILGGTWSNAGSFAVNNSLWTIGGTYPSLGAQSGSGNSLTYSGTYPSTSLVADSSTGNILLINTTFRNARLEARDGARFIVGAGSNLTLDACTLASDLTLNSCASASITNGLTFADGATLLIKNRTCTKASLTFVGAAQTIGGTGRIQIGEAATAADLQITTATKVTLDTGVAIEFRGSGTQQTASVSISSARTLVNRGRISCAVPGSILQINGAGTFTNEGTMESTAGTLVINPGTLTNHTAATGALAGGTWRALGGSLTLGSRSIAQIGADTLFHIRGASITLPSFNTLARNAGTFIIENRAFAGSNPALFLNTGTLELGAGASFSSAGPIEVAPGGRLRTTVASPASLGSLITPSTLTLAGSLSVGFTGALPPTSGTVFHSFASAASVAGAFSSVCFDGNPENLGVTVITNPPAGAPPKTILDLLIDGSGGVAPVIVQQPFNTRATPNAAFYVGAAPANLTYLWRRNGIALADGPSPAGSAIWGAATSYLVIVDAAPADAGQYDCAVSNACSTTLTAAATLSVCRPDLNADGMVDDADFSIFVVAYGILDCTDPLMPPDCPADLNNDLAVDDADFTIFIIAYDALLCP